VVKQTAGILENWNTGMMGSEKKWKIFLISQYSIIPLFHHLRIISS
jgi:hypothetical protein